MTEVCGFCKDTHGRHRLGCPYLVQQEEIAKWRKKNGFTEDMPMRTDGAHMPEECGKVPVGHVYQGVVGPAPLAERTEPPYATIDTYIAENPKDIAGKSKPAFNLLALPAALAAMAKVMKHGADKYGPFNWRTIPITAGAYYAAIGRHWAAMAGGEWLDFESGEPHAAHIMATCAIMLDAKAHGTMKDG